MGQQQLLTLVFGIVAVGGIVIAGTHAISGEIQPKNRDIVFQEAFPIIAEMQLWKLKPQENNGGAGRVGFEGVTFRAIGYDHILLSKRVHRTENGCYQLQTTKDAHDAVLMITSPSCATTDYVAHVVVRGLGPESLDWRYAPPTAFKLLR